VTLLNATGIPQSLSGGYTIPANGELTIDLDALRDLQRVKVWKSISNAVTGKVLYVKGFNDPDTLAAAGQSAVEEPESAPAAVENPPSTV
jgi:hypothetical protein